MFKKRKLEVRLVEDKMVEHVDPTPVTIINKEEIRELAEDLVKKVVIGTVVIIGASVVLHTLGTMSVVALNARLTKEIA
jgi:hypothetical protein